MSMNANTSDSLSRDPFETFKLTRTLLGQSYPISELAARKPKSRVGIKYDLSTRLLRSQLNMLGGWLNVECHQAPTALYLSAVIQPSLWQKTWSNKLLTNCVQDRILSMHGKASRERWKREDRRLKYHVLDGTRPLHGIVIKGMLRSPDIISVDLLQGHHSSFRTCTGYKVTDTTL